MKDWFARVWSGLKTTLIGLRITVPYLFRKPYTLQYPEEVPDLPDTERGLHNFEIVSDEIREMYNEEFVRAWRLYLAGSATGFQSGTLQLYQILFAPAGNNDVPWSRDYLYMQGSDEG